MIYKIDFDEEVYIIHSVFRPQVINTSNLFIYNRNDLSVFYDLTESRLIVTYLLKSRRANFPIKNKFDRQGKNNIQLNDHPWFTTIVVYHCIQNIFYSTFTLGSFTFSLHFFHLFDSFNFFFVFCCCISKGCKRRFEDLNVINLAPFDCLLPFFLRFIYCNAVIYTSIPTIIQKRML